MVHLTAVISSLLIPLQAFSRQHGRNLLSLYRADQNQLYTEFSKILISSQSFRTKQYALQVHISLMKLHMNFRETWLDSIRGKTQQLVPPKPLIRRDHDQSKKNMLEKSINKKNTTKMQPKNLGNDKQTFKSLFNSRPSAQASRSGSPWPRA